MMYALTENNQIKTYPYTYQMLRRDNPNVSFPREVGPWISGYNIVEITSAARPNPSSINVNVVEDIPVLVNSVWTQSWKEVPASAEEIAERTKEQTENNIKIEAKADAFVQQFIEMTPQQISNYIETNVTNLASSKTVLKKLAVMMLLMARREFGE
jgi:hypothetical protein